MTKRRAPSPPTDEACACDACPERIGLGDAVTDDGYCHFCARRCYPLAMHGGLATRIALTLDTRRMLHQHVATPAEAPDPMMAAAAAAAQQLAPHLEPTVRRLAQALWDSIAKRR